jgi:hypothetical protein
MPRRVSRFLALPSHERRLLLLARLQLSLASLAVRLGGLRKAQWLIERLNPPPARSVPAHRTTGVGRTVEIVASASRIGPEGTCLTRSLVVGGLLRRQGIESTLRMGVKKTDTVEGHAWVEVDGQPVNDGPDVADRYAPFHADLR